MRRRSLGIIGRLLILAALVAGAAEVYGSFDRSAYHVVTASELLLRLSPGSLAFLQLDLPSELWETVLQPLLRLPEMGHRRPFTASRASPTWATSCAC